MAATAHDRYYHEAVHPDEAEGAEGAEGGGGLGRDGHAAPNHEDHDDGRPETGTASPSVRYAHHPAPNRSSHPPRPHTPHQHHHHHHHHSSLTSPAATPTTPSRDPQRSNDNNNDNVTAASPAPSSVYSRPRHEEEDDDDGKIYETTLPHDRPYEHISRDESPIDPHHRSGLFADEPEDSLTSPGRQSFDHDSDSDGYPTDLLLPDIEEEEEEDEQEQEKKEKADPRVAVLSAGWNPPLPRREPSREHAGTRNIPAHSRASPEYDDPASPPLPPAREEAGSERAAPGSEVDGSRPALVIVEQVDRDEDQDPDDDDDEIDDIQVFDSISNYTATTNDDPAIAPHIVDFDLHDKPSPGRLAASRHATPHPLHLNLSVTSVYPIQGHPSSPLSPAPLSPAQLSSSPSLLPAQQQRRSRLNKPLPEAPSTAPLLWSGSSTSPSPSQQTEFSLSLDDSSYSSPHTADTLTLTNESPASLALGSLASGPFSSPPSYTDKTDTSNNAVEKFDRDRSYPVYQTQTATPQPPPIPPLHHSAPPHQSAPPQQTVAAQIDEMEDELKGISSELAASIRREMDLEDFVRQLQSERENLQAGGGAAGGAGGGKRTSDYFSDSGASSAKLSDYDQSREEVERIQRKGEQEKAQVRLELTTKLQEERARRRALDVQIQELSRRVAGVDLGTGTDGRGRGGDSNRDGVAEARVKELERSCEELRRGLAEEHGARTNLEGLLAALRGNLRDAVDERDNLRDEIVPSLRARVEGLETEAAGHANLTYESTKLQQELQALLEENAQLRSEQEEAAAAAAMSVASTAAAATAAAAAAQTLAPPPPAPMQRSNSASEPRTGPPRSAELVRTLSAQRIETRDVLSDRLRDVESQRDALHAALRSLLDRQEHQSREHSKRVRTLELERDRLLASSPRAAGFEREVSQLRAEIKMLRRRAEEALEQKWQVEKGLVGLKMDLDRAQEEIASLRALLALPGGGGGGGQADDGSDGGSSGSLERAYRDLQAAYSQSLSRIRQLEAQGPSIIRSEKTELAMRRLEESLAMARSERDAARSEADELRTRANADGLAAGAAGAGHLEAERALAEELDQSARRVEELAGQVRQQLAANGVLRDRLADAVARGDADRKSNIERVNSLQGRLRSLEDHLVAAQNASEDTVARHEAELQALRDTAGSHPQLVRRGNHGAAGSGSSARPRTPLLLSPRPVSPRFPSSRPHSRAASSASAAAAAAANDDDRVAAEEAAMILRSRVSELEGLLSEAEGAMQEVVAKMSTAQIEVMTLREEKEESERETRRLHRQLEEEARKSFQDRFRSLEGIVR